MRDAFAVDGEDAVADAQTLVACIPRHYRSDDKRACGPINPLLLAFDARADLHLQLELILTTAAAARRWRRGRLLREGDVVRMM